MSDRFLRRDDESAINKRGSCASSRIPRSPLCDPASDRTAGQCLSVSLSSPVRKLQHGAGLWFGLAPCPIPLAPLASQVARPPHQDALVQILMHRSALPALPGWDWAWQACHVHIVHAACQDSTLSQPTRPVCSSCWEGMKSWQAACTTCTWHACRAQIQSVRPRQLQHGRALVWPCPQVLTDLPRTHDCTFHASP